MKNSFYIEDIFLEFMTYVDHNTFRMQYQDRSAAYSFYTTIINNGDLTQNQGNYILKILYKYRNVVKPHMEYETELENPNWKKPFRVIDNTKSIWIEEDNDKALWVCLKFPYQFKDTFDVEFKGWQDFYGSKSVWDRERKLRKLYLYDFNIIQMVEFCKKHDFEIMDSAIEAVSAVEEIWNNQEQYLKTSLIENGSVILQNSVEESSKYFLANKTNNINSDLLLAKSLGHLYLGKTNNYWKKIASNKTNIFHCKDINTFLKICYEANGKIVILLDKTDESIEWIKALAWNIDSQGYDKSDFRVCFRTSNQTNPEFNDWVNKNGFGGKIDTAKFLIFREKPAKWLFKDEKDVIIVASNDLLPGLNASAKSMLKSHPCVIYINEYKPVRQHGETIIEL